MRLTFVQLLLVVSYALHTMHPDRVPFWHVYGLTIVCVIELLFTAASKGSNE